MFGVLVFPFVDVRPFLSIATARLSVPTWPIPLPGKHFIRSTGPVRRRQRGGIDVWPGEDVFCDAPHALHFPSGLPRQVQAGRRGLRLSRRCVFRRYLTDGEAVSRYEVGFQFQQLNKSRSGLNGRECLELINSVCRLPVRVSPRNKMPVDCPLVRADKHLATHFLRATTQTHPASPDLPSYWLEAGDTLLVIEYDSNEEIANLPRHSRLVRNLHSSEVQLAHLRMNVEKCSIAVWLLGVDRTGVDLDYLRKLRLYLCRMHAERQAIKQVFRLLLLGRFKADAFTPNSDRLQRFLLESARLLSRRMRDGLPQSEMIDVVMQYEDYVSEGERETLLRSLSHVRPNVLRNIETLTQPHRSAAPHYQIIGEQITITQPGSLVLMDKQNLSIQGGVSGTVNQTAAGNIVDSFDQRIQTAPINSDLKSKLTDLMSAVEGLMNNLGPEISAEVKQDLEVLVQQAMSSKPRQEWYNVSASGLIKAAKAVGEIGEPVVNAVKAVLRLLP
jgi:hypothetical protein